MGDASTNFIATASCHQDKENFVCPTQYPAGINLNSNLRLLDC
jgi:hypothetical protein